jgi:fused signal recognition particle receptor
MGMFNFLNKKSAEAAKIEDNPAPATEKRVEEKNGWLTRLRTGLQKSSDQIAGGITKIFTTRKLDQAALDELEELLIMADLGPELAAELVKNFGREKFGKEVTDAEVREALATQIAEILTPVAQPLMIDETKKPFVILVVGVNGAGKTTTIGKLAQRYQDEGKNVMLAAGDTFRAAAIEQLQVWGDRAGVKVVAKSQGADSAAVAHESLVAARAADAGVLLMDTAGRLHNKGDLMAELQKVVRVIRKTDETAPHAVLLVLDATTGQNAVAQTKTFKELVEVTGLIVTKLDGTAKAGVVVALARQFGLPIHAIGVGEGARDLQAFEAGQFARGLLGMDGV